MPSPSLARRCIVAGAAIIAGVLAACAPPPPPDDAYLADRAATDALLDAYNGRTRAPLGTAAAQIADGIAQRPDLPHAYVQRARLTTALGHRIGREYEPGTIESALEDLDRARELDPTFCGSHLYAAYLYTQTDRLGDALVALDRADALACDDPWRIVHRAVVYLDIERYAEAKTLLDGITDAEPPTGTNARVAYRQALDGAVFLAYRAGDAARMRVLSERRLATVRDDDGAWPIGDTVHWQILAGHFDDAERTARLALSRMDYPAARRQLGIALYGKALWRASRPDAVAAGPANDAAWQEAKQLSPDFLSVGQEDLWSSLANRDVHFRARLQQFIEFARRVAADGEST